MTPDDIEKIINLELFRKKEYLKDELLALKGDPCHSLGLIAGGEIEISQSYPSGNKLIISTFARGDVFGESILFSDSSSYPADVRASEDSSIYFIGRTDLNRLFSTCPPVLDNFLSILSNRILMLSKKIELISHSTIREKIASLILGEYQLQKNLKLILNYGRREMAEILNIPRPSLSRELKHMKEDGLIDYEKNKFQILDLAGLEKVIINGG